MYEAECKLAVEAARLGGAVLRDGIGKIRDVRTVGYKGEVDLVTEYDKRSERLIVEAISRRFPTHTVLAEEGATGGADDRHRWIIDPLDGTTNFAHGYPICCVSIAYEHDGELAVGVVYDPFRGELFRAVRGQGATVNDAPLRVSETPDLAHALLATGFPYDRSTLEPVLERWGRLVRQAQAVRRDGAAALNLCYVGAGRFDGFWEGTLQPWDAAAGALIVREAGGIVTDFHGQPWTLKERSIIAVNGASVLQELLTALA
jgi:myo-inositol-1(or 4)-monophosphatase